MNKNIIDAIELISVTVFILSALIFQYKPNQVLFKPIIAISGIIHIITSWAIFLLYNEFRLRTTYTGKDALFMLLFISICYVGLIVVAMRK